MSGSAILNVLQSFEDHADLEDEELVPEQGRRGDEEEDLGDVDY